MKRLRIYVDTSVFGGSFDPEFATWSRTAATRARPRSRTRHGSHNGCGGITVGLTGSRRGRCAATTPGALYSNDIDRLFAIGIEDVGISAVIEQVLDEIRPGRARRLMECRRIGVASCCGTV